MDKGTRVRVRTVCPPGHIRTPFYLRGKTGTIERVLGPFSNPEQLAIRQTAEAVTLYRVNFSMAEVWGADTENPGDTIEAELFAHWLTPMEVHDAT